MDHIIQFEKFESGHLAMFVCKDGGWQLGKELGFHKCSPPRDYLVRWIECDGKLDVVSDAEQRISTHLPLDNQRESRGRWTLYITSYNSGYNVICKENYIVTVDTIFDVLDYICKNKHTHY